MMRIKGWFFTMTYTPLGSSTPGPWASSQRHRRAEPCAPQGAGRTVPPWVFAAQKALGGSPASEESAVDCSMTLHFLAGPVWEEGGGGASGFAWPGAEVWGAKPHPLTTPSF